MHNVARHMDEAQMEDVAAYIASLPAGSAIGTEGVLAGEGR